MKFLKLNDRGDTIAEVLIAVAIVGFVLAISFRLANRSFQTSRNAQERSEALKLAEEQFERIKANKDDFVGFNNPYCADSTLQRVGGFLGGYKEDDTQGDTLSTSGSYPPQCADGFYFKAVNNTPSDSLMKVTIRWINRAGGNNEVKMFYRLRD